jgi:hypothetical protein
MMSSPCFCSVARLSNIFLEDVRGVTLPVLHLVEDHQGVAGAERRGEVARRLCRGEWWA